MIKFRDPKGPVFQINPELPVPELIETGGYLLGRYLNDSDDRIIDIITYPLPMDLRGPRELHLLDPGHAERIREEWMKSDGTCHMLGHWHTHYEHYPNPSYTDIKGMLKMAKEVKQSSGLTPVTFVIIGREQVRAWNVFDEEIIEMEEINES